MSQQVPPQQSLAPSQIFVCRHGARLDASDSTWHLTSPTPYDPPLTYGGWTQARSLGNRIAGHIVSHIAAEHPTLGTPTAKPIEKAGIWSASTSKTPGGVKETKPNAPANNANSGPRISKPAASKLQNTKIVVHTSPFLRCVQTSIAVTAGMSQYFSDISLQVEDSNKPDSATTNLDIHPRPILRIEGFLSEWLCEDYFAEITPPPACDLMVGTAKIDLMRPSSAGGLKKHYTAQANLLVAPQHHHHGHGRAHSVGFIPPLASSAVGKNEPIPRGHVSHAKDFCDVDYSYDSLRHGDGGEYGEEWGKMHKRVKVGFEKILVDYANGDVAACLKSQLPNQPSVSSFDQLVADSNAAPSSANEIDIPGNTILVFISHGAICNALVGAMTHQPVLMDIGIASMSMGVLVRPVLPTTTQPSVAPAFDIPRFGIPDDSDMEDTVSPPGDTKPFSPYSAPADPSANNNGVPQYNVKIKASTDHLRSTSNVKSPALGPAQGGSFNGGAAPLPRPRKSSVGGSGFSMYNNAGKLPTPLIGSSGSGNSGGTGLFTSGRAMGMVFGNSGGSSLGGNKGPAMGVRRTASAAASTKGLWNRQIADANEMERGSSDEGAVVTDEESVGSGEDKQPRKFEKEKPKDEPPKERKPSVSGGAAGMWGAGRGAVSGGRGGLWNSGANTDRRRRWTVANREDDGTENQ